MSGISLREGGEGSEYKEPVEVLWTSDEDAS